MQFNNKVASLKLDNGYTVVVRKNTPATTVGAEYEFELVPMNSIISDDKIGYCTKDDITELIRESSSLPSK